MARPRKHRKICSLPKRNKFGPVGIEKFQLDHIIMAVDEYETIRLIDYMGFTQEECAQQMNVARTTVQSIYAKARQKIADCLVNGKVLLIEGGEYKLCGGNGCGPGCHKHAQNN